MAFTGSWNETPPSTVTEEFTFSVDVNNTGTGQNVKYRAMVIDTSTGDRLGSISDILLFHPADSTQTIEFIVVPDEITFQGIPNGTYDLNILVAPLTWDYDVSVANRSLTIDLPGNDSGTGDDGTGDDGTGDDGTGGDGGTGDDGTGDEPGLFDSLDTPTLALLGVAGILVVRRLANG